MKHKITMLCAALTALTMLQPAVCAAEETTAQTYRYFNYEECGDHVILNSYTPASNKMVIVPRSIHGLPVTEAAEGLFPYKSGQARYIIWADTIPVIPADAFSDNPDISAVIIPDTVTEIGDNIFGDNSEVDIFYRGTAEQWDAIKVGKGNSALMDCNILCEWGAGETPFSFDFSEDTWSFSNASVEKYMFSEEAGERYLGDLTDRNRNWIQSGLELISSNENFPGICGGMAVSSYLCACGMLDPSDIYPGAKTLREIPLCDEVREALNLYLDQSSLGLGAVHAGDEYDENYMEYLTWNIQDYLGDGFVPGVVMLALYNLGGIHAVVAYGTESGEWVIDGVTYHDRILIYDNNAPDPETDANLYVADDGTFYDPFYSEEGAIQVFGLLSRPDIYPFMIGQRTVYEPTYELGDLDQDGAANAADASDILTISTEQGTGRSVDMTIGELYAADVDGDGSVDAVDASIILTYSTAQAVSDHTLDIKDFT